jgi:hypothetical protein
MNCKVVYHFLYNLDLSPCDFHVLGLLKKVTNDQIFRMNKDVKDTVVQWNQQQTTQFFVERMISWCFNRIPASTCMGTIFNSLYSFAQNNPQMGFI